MVTTRKIIDVHNDRLSMTVLGENVQLDVFNAMSLPSCAYDDCLLIDETNENFCEQLIEQCRDEDEEALAEEVHTDVHETLPEDEEIKAEAHEGEVSGEKKNELELKELPAHLKYVFLEMRELTR